jgi:Tfp pilus assembly protein PilF
LNAKHPGRSRCTGLDPRDGRGRCARRWSRNRPLLPWVLGALLTISGGCATWAPNTAAPTSKTQIGVDPSKTAEWCWATAEEKERAGEDQQAAAFYEQARLLAPQAQDYGGRLARLYDRLNQDEAAQREYGAAIERSPNDADLLNDYGVFHLRRGQWTVAESWFRRALDVHPGHDRASVNLAISLGMQDRRPESYEAFARVVGSAAAYCNLGVLLHRQGQTDAARDHFEQALQLDPSLEPARQLLTSAKRE